MSRYDCRLLLEGARYRHPTGALIVMALHTKPVGKEKTRKKQWDLREAALAAVILASGVWMIVAGLMKLCCE